MILSRQGVVRASRWFYAMYHPRWNGEGEVIHLNGDDLDFHKSNLYCGTKREINNLVHFNNKIYVKGNKKLQRLSLKYVKSCIALSDLEKEVKSHEEI